MKVLSLAFVAFASLHQVTVVAQEDGVGGCDCASQIQGATADIFAATQELHSQLESRQGDLDRETGLARDCIAAELTATAAAEERTNQWNALKEELAELKKKAETLEDLEGELDDVKYAIRTFNGREEDSRNRLIPGIEEFRERTEEITKYILEKQIKTAELANEIVEAITNPAPFINGEKIREDFQRIWQSMLSLRKQPQAEAE
jgi:adenylate kinase family enzyme